MSEVKDGHGFGRACRRAFARFGMVGLLVQGLFAGVAHAGILMDDVAPAPKEGEVALPALPAEADLIPFSVGPTSARNHFFVDRRSVELTKDGVLRYTVVIQTPGGARNIRYEGVNCTRGEVRAYAYAGASGSWDRARNDAWEPIGDDGYNGYRAALAHDAWCIESAPVQSAKEALDKLVAQRYALDPLFPER